VSLCDDSVRNVIEGWVGRRRESVFEVDEAEAGCCDESCVLLDGDLDVSREPLAYRMRKERIELATIFSW
jgi:hypothetical protein